MDSRNASHVPTGPLFYCPDISAKRYSLCAEESIHIAAVMRLKAGRHVRVTDGRGTLDTGVLTSVNPKKCTIEAIDRKRISPRRYPIHIAIAPTKNMRRIEWFVEKAVEIGIDRIGFVLCRNAERARLQTERLKKKAVSALKQSQQVWLPDILPLVTFDEAIERADGGFIAHASQPAFPTLGKAALPGRSYTVLIGPEGGFADKEIATAKEQGWQGVSLGSSILRTETAGIVACHTLHVIQPQYLSLGA